LSHYLAGVKGYPFEVQLPADLEVEGAVLSDQIKSLDWRVRRARYACAVPAAILDEVLGKVLALIDPSEGG
jgi:mRNA interferase MazF